MKAIILLICSWILISPLWGQGETIQIGDPAPFSGELHYVLSWKGPNTALWANHLADSMVLNVGPEGIRARYFGGISDSLIHEFVWLTGQNGFFLLDTKHMIAYTNPPGLEKQQASFTPVKGEIEPSSLLDHPCSAFQSLSEGFSDTYWLSEDIYYPHSNNDSLGGVPAFLSSDAQTIPLRMERRTPDGVVVTTTVVKLIEQPESGLVESLSGYVEKPFSMHTGRHAYFPPKEK